VIQITPKHRGAFLVVTLSVAFVAAIGCGDGRSTGMGPDKPSLGGLTQGPTFPDESDATAPVIVGDDGLGDEDVLGEDASLVCDDGICGEGSTCRLLLSTTSGVSVPTCIPDGCDESPPAELACPQTCASGYATNASVPTCGCCSIGDEPVFRLCYDDKDCSAFERCDHSFCESSCAPGLLCAAMCAGRCNAAALVPAL
jgi:hypothetical protein